MLPGIVTEFRKQHPDIQLIINQADINDSANESDLYVFASDFPVKDECCKTLLTEDCLIGMSSDNPLTSYDMLSPEMLKNETFLTLQGNTPLSRLTRSFCEKGGFYPKVVLELVTTVQFKTKGAVFRRTHDFFMRAFTGRQCLFFRGKCP